MSRILNIVSDNITPLPIYLHSIDNHHLQEDVYSPGGRKFFYQILIVKDGCGILKCNNTKYNLRRGSAFFLSPNTPHRYTNTGNLTTAYVAVCGSAVPLILSHFDNNGFLYYDNINVNEYVSKIQQIINEFNEKRRESILSSMLYSIFLNFFEKDRDEKNSSLDNTILYIEKNYMKKLTLDKLSQINQSSVSKLCHDFKRKYNCSVFTYIVNYRLNCARTLLKTDCAIKIKEAAILSGFDDISYFCRAYKTKFGVNPSDDR